MASGATINAGAGISVSNIVVRSAQEIQANFNVAADAPGGNHSVTVTVNGLTSNSVNFFMQIPSRLQFIDTPPRAPNGIGPLITINDGDVLSTSGSVEKTHQCGVYRNLAYELVDVDGESIVQGFMITENFNSYSGVDKIPAPLTMNISPNNVVGRCSSEGYLPLA